MENKYYKRYIEEEIENALQYSGCVMVRGPKFCGKTTTCLRYAKSSIKLNTSEIIDITKINPKWALKGEIPHLIDEWQKVPSLQDYIKDDLDNEYIFGKYILTGSSTPSDKTQINHSGAGRIAKLDMRTLSLFESEESKGTISLKELFSNPSVDIFDANKSFSIENIAYYMCRGGWPLIRKITNEDQALEATKSYFKNIFDLEENNNDSYRNLDSRILYALTLSYSRNVSTECTNKTLLDDTKAILGREKFDEDTFLKYLDALKDLFIIKDIQSWRPSFRSKTMIRSSSTRHFIDTSIAVASLKMTPLSLLKDLNTFGLLFEDFVIKELSIYVGSNGEIRHYRDDSDLEVDAIVLLNNGEYGAFEIKLGGEERIKEGIASLKRFKEKIKTKSNEMLPKVMGVITAFGPSYKEDDIFIIPINLLRD